MSTTFKNKTSLRTIEAQIVQNLRTMRLGQNLLALIKNKKACMREGQKESHAGRLFRGSTNSRGKTGTVRRLLALALKFVMLIL